MERISTGFVKSVRVSSDQTRVRVEPHRAKKREREKKIKNEEKKKRKTQNEPLITLYLCQPANQKDKTEC